MYFFKQLKINDVEDVGFGDLQEAKICAGGRAPHSAWRNYDDFNEFFWCASSFWSTYLHFVNHAGNGSMEQEAYILFLIMLNPVWLDVKDFQYFYPCIDYDLGKENLYSVSAKWLGCCHWERISVSYIFIYLRKLMFHDICLFKQGAILFWVVMALETWSWIF